MLPGRSATGEERLLWMLLFVTACAAYTVWNIHGRLGRLRARHAARQAQLDSLLRQQAQGEENLQVKIDEVRQSLEDTSVLFNSAIELAPSRWIAAVRKWRALPAA